MRIPNTVAPWIAWWACLFGLYLLLVLTQAWPEIAGGALAAAVAASGATALTRVGRLHFRPRLGWLRRFVGIPWRIVADCAILASALGRALVLRRPVDGSFRVVPFTPGGDDGESAARRALVVAGICVAPNTFVVAVDRERGTLVVHQLVPAAQTPGGGNREWPL